MTDTEGGYLGPQNLVLRFRSRLADEPGVTSFMRCIVRALSMLALVATMVATGFATCAFKALSRRKGTDSYCSAWLTWLPMRLMDSHGFRRAPGAGVPSELWPPLAVSFGP